VIRMLLGTRANKQLRRTHHAERAIPPGPHQLRELSIRRIAQPSLSTRGAALETGSSGGPRRVSTQMQQLVGGFDVVCRNLFRHFTACCFRHMVARRGGAELGARFQPPGNLDNPSVSTTFSGHLGGGYESRGSWCSATSNPSAEKRVLGDWRRTLGKALQMRENA